MNWTEGLNLSPKWLGVILFFLVPLVIWVIVVLFARLKNKSFKFFGLIIGGDNRLSLSKLQALAWTLVIFGSYFAAMGVHQPINPNIQAEADAAKREVEIAESRAKTLTTDLETAKTKLDNANKEKAAADKAYNDAKANVDKLAANSAATPEQKNAAQAELTEKEKTLNEKATVQTNAQTNLDTAQKSFSDAQKSAQTLKEIAESKANEAAKNRWVDIPLALLALAGIAIGSGIFSSLISAVSGEKQNADATGVEPVSPGDANVPAGYPNKNNLLKIKGSNFGTKKGTVRFGRAYGLSQSVPVLFWSDNEIIVDVTSDVVENIILDTSTGKLTYKLNNAFIDHKAKKNKIEKDLAAAKAELKKVSEDPTATTNTKDAAQKKVNDLETELKKYSKNDASNLSLGDETSSYEFSDLFRDDKNPINLDLMKFQMFGWTVIAIFIYSWLFLQNLNKNITTLPLVPEAIVLLTGLSQAGYLAGKGVSNVPKNENTAGSNP